ncbi:hypothetical protein D9619_004762 [Psilocybe cf. subviscida]|uniref:Nephrocystin 3-like N-terminal domain-containing protein n=1 Tax=Psilocybe cf. subviscida TaxID=2480587 RepID=A0A8H5F843_9AGAR|nr:hypothetical protein D9619_004762 [Psilocybe cf. subviscida]
MDISNAIITGGVFTVTNSNCPQLYYYQEAPLRSSRTMDRFLDAVAHSAFHNSVERSDPICKAHSPNAVAHAALRQRIRIWATQSHQQTGYNDDGSQVIYSVSVPMPILWLTGRSGTGKSALAQSIAEELDAQRRLLARFFFDRADATRNHPRAFVATLAYQMYQNVPPPFQERMLAVIERDPLVFKRSMAVQFEQLIRGPLHDLIADGYFDGTMAARVFVIDGLDECLDTAMRRCVLDTIFNAVTRDQLPFVFFISCRPEQDIQIDFDSHRKVVETLVLEKQQLCVASPDKEQFLRENFLAALIDHPYCQYQDLPFAHFLLFSNIHNFFHIDSEHHRAVGLPRMD